MCSQDINLQTCFGLPDELSYGIVANHLQTPEMLPLLKVSRAFRTLGGDVHLLKEEFEYTRKWNERLKKIVEDHLGVFGDAAKSDFLKGWSEFKNSEILDGWKSLAQAVQIFLKGMQEINLDDLSVLSPAEIPAGNAVLTKRKVKSTIESQELLTQKINEKIEMATQDRGVLSFGMRIMTDERCKLFLDVLSKRSEITTITVDSELTDQQLKMLADALDPSVTSSPLPIKNFVLNMEREIPLENLAQIFTAIARNPSIRSLMFGEYYLSDQSLETVSKKLQDLVNVNSLSIKHCIFTPEAIQRLMSILTRNPNLKEFSLNGCSKEALREIFRSLNSSQLTSISLTNCPFDDEIAWDLAAALENNTTLEMLVINPLQNAASKEELEKLHSVLQRKDNIIYASVPKYTKNVIPPLQKYGEQMVTMISNRLKCLHKRYSDSAFIKEFDALKNEEKSTQIQSAAKSSDIFRMGLEELDLGELMALDGNDKSLQNKDLWKQKITEASQDRGVITLNASVGKDSFETFLDAAMEMDAVKFLCINTELSDSQMSMLVRALNPKYTDTPLKLEGISLSMDREMPGEIFDKFLIAISKNPTLRDVSFTNYYLNKESMDLLNDRKKELGHLKRLSLKYTA